MKLYIHSRKDKGKEFLVVPREPIGQERDAIQAVNLPEIYPGFYLLKTGRGVKSVFRKSAAKIIQRLAVEKMAMGWVSVGRRFESCQAYQYIKELTGC
jgi:hypothetical protein